MSKPICFKIRGGVEREDGSRGSTHIGKMAGKGYLGSEDMAFTCLSTNDQYLFAGQGEGSYTFPFTKPPMSQRKLKYLSLFSGIEAASVAWKDLGWEPVGFSEIEPFPCAVLKHRFPNTPNYGDITKWKEWGLVPGTVDVVCAGSPCQAFSTAGLRKGLDDPRGNLALVTLGLVEFLKPKWFIWENVPGVLTAQSGSAFGAILTALGDIGYGWSYRVLDAQHFGVPQRRRRVWLCGYRDPVTGVADWRPPAAVLSFSESLCWNPAKSWKKRKAPADDAASGAGATGNEGGAGAGCWWDGGQVSQTLDAVLSKGQTMPEKNRFPAVLEPTPFRKSKRAQSETDDESWVEGQEANTLNNFDLGDTRTTHAVVEPICFEPRSQDGHARVCGDVSPTLNTAQVGQRQPCVAISFQPGNLRREAGADPSTKTFPTLKCDSGDQSPHVAIVQASELRMRGEMTEKDICPTLTAGAKQGDTEPLAVHPVIPLDGMNLLSRLGECGENHSIQSFNPGDPSFTLKKGGTQHGILTPMAVRRLTPTECLRLQGFPDGWTQIPWKGKTAEECPDGPQYKAIGNSWAVPCARYIGERINMVEEIKDELAKKA
jgi:DNA (cytosine-5)-methyltransferase 1